MQYIHKISINTILFMKHFTTSVFLLLLAFTGHAQIFIDNSSLKGHDNSDWSLHKIGYQLPDTIIQHPKVLFIGNSFTFYNDMPSLFKGLCISGGHNVDVTSLTAGSAFLADFAYTADSTTLSMQTDSIIAAFKPDWTFLQDQSLVMLNVAIKDYSNSAVQAFVEKLNNAKLRAMLYMTWPYRDGQSFYSNAYYTDYNTPALMADGIYAGYLSISRTNEICLSPAGIAFYDVVKKHPEINMYWPDGAHPSKIGSYLVACCHYAALFRESPVGLSYNAGLDATTVKVLQETASRIVLDNVLDLSHLESPVKLELEESTTWTSQVVSDAAASGGKVLKVLYLTDYLTDDPYPIYTTDRFDIALSKLVAVDVAYKSDGNQQILLQTSDPNRINYTDIDTLRVGNTNGKFVTQRFLCKNNTAKGVGTLAFKYISGTPNAYYDCVVLHFNENELTGLTDKSIATFNVNYWSDGAGVAIKHNANEEVRIAIYDVNGRLCRRVDIPSGATKTLPLAAGVYVLTAQTSAGSLVKKISIVK